MLRRVSLNLARIEEVRLNFYLVSFFKVVFTIPELVNVKYQEAGSINIKQRSNYYCSLVGSIMASQILLKGS